MTCECLGKVGAGKWIWGGFVLSSFVFQKAFENYWNSAYCIAKTDFSNNCEWHKRIVIKKYDKRIYLLKKKTFIY